MAPDSLTVLVAFTAGLLSFLSPCVLPLVPSYITFITGMGLDDVSRSRRAALTHAVLFVIGFSFIFVGHGARATALGPLLLAKPVWIARGGGGLMVLNGLRIIGVFKKGSV
ncbi:cytochrome c biogenesis protein CcdA, partial [Gemmatimonas sp.]|uniref:cytochrome c biogenesis CcdA family protein n=1 Tax=Gemmatimonas sp. TaxID=1962908 RepID=UPI00286C5BFF